MTRLTNLLVVLILCFGAAVNQGQSIPSDFATSVKTFVTATMQCPQYNYPGLSLSIVKDGKTILSEGYGLSDIQKNIPCTNETLFGIGSCSKSFTGVLFGMLEKEGKVTWKDRVRKFIPEFSMADDQAGQSATITDLFVHRTGLPRHDFLLFSQYNLLSRKELSSRVKYLESNLEFRETFQYNNIMYAVLGDIIERITNTPWEEYIKTRIFSQLNMKSTSTNVSQSIGSAQYAQPYSLLNGSPTPFPIDVNKVVSSSTDGYALGAPGGGIISNANDMSKWLQMLTSNDNSLISRSSLEQIWTPIQSIPPSFSLTRPMVPTSIVTFGYGLGWMSMQYNGVWITFHGGTIVGNLALVLVAPKLNLGISLMTNIDSDPNGLRLIAFHIIDLILGDTPLLTPATVCHWSCNFVNCSSQSPRPTVNDNQPITSCQGDKRNEQVIGEFRHNAYGTISISASTVNGLALQYSQFTGQCVQWNNDHSFTISLSGPVLLQPLNFEVTVNVDSDSPIVSISLPLEATVSNIVFTKIVDEDTQSDDTLPAWGIALIVIGSVSVVVVIVVLISLKIRQKKMTLPKNGSDYLLVTENL